MFQKHPSIELQNMFRGYQGQDPAKAKVILYGVDANYPADVERYTRFFDELRKYNLNGVAFWQQYGMYGIHHPFLLYKAPSKLFPQEEFPFKRDSFRYHERFSKLDLVKFAEFITFVELLSIPTTGSSEKKEKEKVWWKLYHDFNSGKHAKSIDEAMELGTPKLVLLPEEVIRKMRKVKHIVNKTNINTIQDKKSIFWWINQNVTEKEKPFKLSSSLDEKGFEVYKITHLTYASNLELNHIRELIVNFCNSH
jgi:hypothetical protein